MIEIAKEAGVGVGTVYRHFPTPDALVRAVIVKQIADGVEKVRAFAEPDVDPWEAVAGVFHGAIAIHLATAGTTPSLQQLADGTAPETFEVSRELAEVIEQVLSRARAAGVLRPDGARRRVAHAQLWCRRGGPHPGPGADRAVRTRGTHRVAGPEPTAHDGGLLARDMYGKIGNRLTVAEQHGRAP